MPNTTTNTTSHDVEVMPDRPCPICSSGPGECCWNTSGEHAEITLDDPSSEWHGFWVHAARVVPTCPCATTGCAARGCQCPCADCSRVRLARESEDRATCTRCHESRPVSDYATRASGRRQSWCRACHAEHARTRRASGASRPRVTRSTHSERLERQFGVEIECIYDHAQFSYVEDAGQACAAAFQAAGLQCQYDGYTHQVLRRWKIVTDGSVGGGFEVVSPILRGESGKAELREAMRVLREFGCTVNTRCGLHVHHDVTDLTAVQIAGMAHLWADSQTAIDSLVAPSRHGTQTYLGPLDADTLYVIDRFALRHGDTRVSHESASLRLDRYRNLNLASYPLYGTVEVRQHQGTLNGTKALAWVEFGQAIIERAKAGECVPSGHVPTIREVLRSCESAGLSPVVAAFLEDRAAGFAGNAIAS